MKIYVNRLVLDRDTKEEKQIVGEIYTEDIACLYRGNDKTSIHSKNGQVMIVNHSLREVEQLIIYHTSKGLR